MGRKAAWIFSLATAVAVFAQSGGKPAPAGGTPAPEDSLGRSTPRGTVLGFLNAARKGDNARAARYLNTKKREQSAQELAHQLFVVLDRKLPARLNQLSDAAEGSLAYPAEPNLDLVGTVEGASGNLEIQVERVTRNGEAPIWLFAAKTLASIPDLYAETQAVEPGSLLPAFLVENKFLGIALFEWLAILAGLPLAYMGIALLNRGLRAGCGTMLRRVSRRTGLQNPEVLPGPVRLLLLALLMRWAASGVSLPLLARQFWSSLAAIVTIVAAIWLVIRVNTWGEAYLCKRIGRRNRTGMISIVRFGRRAADVLVLFVGTLVALHYFGVNVGAAIAGLGVGGIAVALAAQKTLENVIGGISLIFDQTVRVGDALKVADTAGTVEAVGLRSIRIRTPDRTVVSVPNGQVANASLEDYSARDKFWFHHIIGLRYDSTAEQVRAVVAGLIQLLTEHPAVDRESVQVRLLRFGTSSLDVEVFAYLAAEDIRRFLEMQGELLLRTMELIQGAGAQLALPSQMLHIAGNGQANPAADERAVSAAGTGLRS